MAKYNVITIYATAVHVEIQLTVQQSSYKRDGKISLNRWMKFYMCATWVFPFWPTTSNFTRSFIPPPPALTLSLACTIVHNYSLSLTCPFISCQTKLGCSTKQSHFGVTDICRDLNAMRAKNRMVSTVLCKHWKMQQRSWRIFFECYTYRYLDVLLRSFVLFSKPFFPVSLSTLAVPFCTFCSQRVGKAQFPFTGVY